MTSTLKYDRIIAGAFVRGRVRQILSECERVGAKVYYLEKKGFLESEFSNVSIRGTYAVTSWAYDSLTELFDE